MARMRYPFREMQPGDNFMAAKDKAASVFGLVCRHNKAAGKKIFQANMIEGQVRVVRLSDEGAMVELKPSMQIAEMAESNEQAE